MIVLLLNQVPVDRAGENRLEVGIRLRFPCLRTVERLLVNVLEPRHELKTEQMAEAKGDLVLPISLPDTF